MVTSYGVEAASKRVRHGEAQRKLLAWRQGSAESPDLSALLRKDADKLKTVEESHAMPDHGTQGLQFGDFRNGKLQRDHFSRAEFTGHDRPQPVFCDFKATAVNAEISILPQDPDDQRQLGAVAGVTPCRGLVHASNSCSLICCLSGKAPGVDAMRTGLSSQKPAGLARGGHRKVRYEGRGLSGRRTGCPGRRKTRKVYFGVAQRTRSSTG